MVASAGTERLPDAVPIVCRPGDVAITNRQTVHGLFANTSPDWRVTVNFGFHRRRSVLGVRTRGTLHAPAATYDEAHIRERARLIGLAIDARRQRFPMKSPLSTNRTDTERFQYTTQTQSSLKDYNLLDLSI